MTFKARSDPTRRALLDALRDEPKTTGDLCAAPGDPRALGEPVRFYEEGPNGSGALHCTVTQVIPGERLWMTGSMGMRVPVVGNIHIDPEEKGAETLLKFSHHVIGPVGEATEQNYTGGWKYLLGVRLKNLVETGNPEGAN